MKIFLTILSVYLLIGLGLCIFCNGDNHQDRDKPKLFGVLLVMISWPLILIFSYICVKKGFETLDDFKNYIKEKENETMA